MPCGVRCIELWRSAWREIREALLEAERSLRQALPYISTRLIVVVVVASMLWPRRWP